MFTKTKIIILNIAILLSVANIFAQGGTTGSLTWNINNGTLTISGNGDMPDYAYGLAMPWADWKSYINTVIIENGVTSVGKNAFFNHEYLNSITIGSAVKSIGEQSFYSCENLYSITFPNSVISIGTRAFWGCHSLYSVAFGDNITSIGKAAFHSCKLFSVAIPDKITIIEEETFRYCSLLSSVIIPEGVTTIGKEAFSYCMFLNSITIPNTVQTIGEAAFLLCDGLISIILGNSVTNIGPQAFRYCDQVLSITSHAIIPPVLAGSAVFGEVPVTIPVNIPCLSYNNYSNASGWKNFTNFVVDGPTTEYKYSAKCYLPYSDDNFTSLNVFGIHSIHLENSAGCDSIVTLILIENPRPQLCMVTVNESFHNEIIWKEWEEDVPYNIYREDPPGGQYNLVATIEPNSSNRWVDMESNAIIRSYRYKVSGTDSCGKESILSSPHKTMHLTIDSGQDNSWNLLWTAYEGTEYSTCNIYRATGNTIGEFELIGTLPTGNTSFSDFGTPEGYVYYLIEILLNETCNIGKSNSSIKSNIATNNPSVGVDDFRFTIDDLKVYPNPTTGELKIENGELKIENVEVFYIYGRKQKIIINYQLSIIHSINISHLPANMYFLRIMTDHGEVIKKVVKQ